MSNGSGGACWGTIAGFRNLPNPQDYVEFVWNGTHGSFGAVFGGNSFGCEAYQSDVLAVMSHAAFATRGYFTIYWDTNHNCTFLVFHGGSPYGP
jgi:hypothetical protein